MVDEWSKALYGKQSVYAIFFDFSKAFDLVDPELLLAKLNKLLPPMTTRWIANYLHGRKQRVNAGWLGLKISGQLSNDIKLSELKFWL